MGHFRPRGNYLLKGQHVPAVALPDRFYRSETRGLKGTHGHGAETVKDRANAGKNGRTRPRARLFIKRDAGENACGGVRGIFSGGAWCPQRAGGEGRVRKWLGWRCRPWLGQLDAIHQIAPLMTAIAIVQTTMSSSRLSRSVELGRNANVPPHRGQSRAVVGGGNRNSACRNLSSGAAGAFALQRPSAMMSYGIS